MATAQLDIPQLCSYFALPQTTITTILDAPTSELVRTLLDKVSAKAREHDEVTSEKLKLEVELENAVRTGETKNRVLKTSMGKSLKEVTDLRQKLQAEGKVALELYVEPALTVLAYRELKSYCRVRTTNDQVVNIIHNLRSIRFEFAHRLSGILEPRHSVPARIKIECLRQAH